MGAFINSPSTINMSLLPKIRVARKTYKEVCSIIKGEMERLGIEYTRNLYVDLIKNINKIALPDRTLLIHSRHEDLVETKFQDLILMSRGFEIIAPTVVEAGYLVTFLVNWWVRSIPVLLYIYIDREDEIRVYFPTAGNTVFNLGEDRQLFMDGHNNREFQGTLEKEKLKVERQTATKNSGVLTVPKYSRWEFFRNTTQALLEYEEFKFQNRYWSF